MPRQRATSPSEQSSSSWRWISAKATTAQPSPGSVSAPAANTPAAIISQVTPLGVIGVRISSRVRYGEKRRMRMRPSQCSPLLRSKIEGGWVAARSSAIEGFDIAADMLAHAGVVEGEVLEQRVAVRARARRVGDGLGELLGAEPEVGRQP